MSIYLICLAVFAITFGLDFAWAGYTSAVSQGRIVAAGIWAGAITLFASVNVLIYIHNPYLVIVSVCGAVVGTMAQMEMAKRAKARS